MLKGAIFDMDGTILDSMGVWESFGREYLLTLGIVAPDDLNEYIRAMTLQQAAQYFIDTYHLDKTVDKIIEESNDLCWDLYAQRLLLKDGAAEFIKDLHDKGVRICLATATDRHLAEAALVRLGVAPYFSEIFTCTSVGASKNEPVIYEASLKHLGTEKTNTLVFEDVLHAATCAHNAGFLVCGVYDEMEDRQEAFRAVCDCYIESYRDLKDFWVFAEKL